MSGIVRVLQFLCAIRGPLRLLWLTPLLGLFSTQCKPTKSGDEAASATLGSKSALFQVTRKLGTAAFNHGDYSQATLRSITKDWQTNIARRKEVKQSSTFGDLDAARAIDGDANGILVQGSVAVTRTEANPWFQIDLAGEHEISAVTVWSRTDCCMEQLAGARVQVLSASGQIVATRPLAKSLPFLPSQGVSLGGVSGRYVKILGAPHTGLALAEVEVWEKATSPAQGVCWKKSQGRGVGRPVSQCRGHEEKQGALCYPRCPQGWSGQLDRCWEPCPEGFTDDGLTCRRPNPIKVQGQKSTYRGAGRPMDCGENQEYQAGLCYKPCPAGMVGNGPICWGQCTQEYAVNCGAACGTSAWACSDAIKDMVLAPINTVANIASMVTSFGTASAIKAGVRVATEGAVASSQALLAGRIASIAVDGGKHVSEAVAKEVAAAALGESTFDWRTADPTGVAELIRAFDQPSCGDVD